MIRSWGAGAFENSAAMDWLGGLASGQQLADLRAALELREGEEERAIARAAATLVAAAVGEGVTGLPETAKRWLRRQDAGQAEALRGEAMGVAQAVSDVPLAAALTGGRDSVPGVVKSK